MDCVMGRRGSAVIKESILMPAYLENSLINGDLSEIGGQVLNSNNFSMFALILGGFEDQMNNK